jgi:hypothetical protein
VTSNDITPCPPTHHHFLLEAAASTNPSFFFSPPCLPLAPASNLTTSKATMVLQEIDANMINRRALEKFLEKRFREEPYSFTVRIPPPPGTRWLIGVLV